MLVAVPTNQPQEEVDDLIIEVALWSQGVQVMPGDGELGRALDVLERVREYTEIGETEKERKYKN